MNTANRLGPHAPETQKVLNAGLHESVGPAPEERAAVAGCAVANGSECAALDAQGNIQIGDWPGNVMVRLQLPVPVRELADILNALSDRAKGEGRQARMRQVGTVLEVFTIPNTAGQTAGGQSQPKA
jgi:hypothetical protein